MSILKTNPMIFHAHFEVPNLKKIISLSCHTTHVEECIHCHRKVIVYEKKPIQELLKNHSRYRCPQVDAQRAQEKSTRCWCCWNIFQIPSYLYTCTVHSAVMLPLLRLLRFIVLDISL